jgi:hypothetical protein
VTWPATAFFQQQVILVRYILTHKEYDEGQWKSTKPAQKNLFARYFKVEPATFLDE